MVSTENTLLGALAPLKLYDLSAGTMTYGEIASYGAAIDLLAVEIEPILLRIFAASCAEADLVSFEKLLDLPVSNTTEAYRRKIIGEKFAVAQGDFNTEGILRSVRAAGLDAKIEEKPRENAVKLYDAVITGGFSTLDEVKRQVYAMLPAHVNAEFDVGMMTWTDFDSKGLTMAQLDRVDFTWEWFDLNGDKL